MKKVIAIAVFLVLFSIFALIIINSPSRTLYLLNWGEYIDHDLVKKFEEEYNCQVIEETVVSSEAMYQKIKAKTTTYDVAIPGDYVVSQLHEEGMLLELDTDAYPNMQGYEEMFTDSLKEMIEENMRKNGETFNTYFMPYFWGAYSIIYANANPEVEDIVKEYGFRALYDRNLYSKPVKIGMYDTARWVLASYLMAYGYDPNITTYELNDGKPILEGDLASDLVNDAIKNIKAVGFDEFGNDQLKRNVVKKQEGRLDLCFTQLGDFFDALYLVYDQSGEEAYIDFNVCVPSSTAAFFDAMIIPSTCHDYDLANEFINFMLDPQNAYDNACSIGYCPTLKEVCNIYREEANNGAYYYGNQDSPNNLTLKDFLEKYPMYLDPLYSSDKDKTYMFLPKPKDYLTSCEEIYNNLY